MAEDNRQKKAAGFMAGKMSADAFDRALSAGQKPLRRRLRGWAKESHVADCIAFAPLSRCGLWVDLPKQMIAEVEIVGEVTCEEHTHADVWIVLGEDDPRNAAISQLVQALARTDAERDAAIREHASRRGTADRMPSNGCLAEGGTCKNNGCRGECKDDGYGGCACVR
ncbi:hypothetical protein [Sandaracinus amylolyticus]|uniref:hypothetical protein n=1 Tax=Sandaracinus amylolyticus TaxID=927083 RepID=UPI0012EE1DB2|nr:hypothetical protein [Sandaracinus amylolyticus]